MENINQTITSQIVTLGKTVIETKGILAVEFLCEFYREGELGYEIKIHTKNRGHIKMFVTVPEYELLIEAFKSEVTRRSAEAERCTEKHKESESNKKLLSDVIVEQVMERLELYLNTKGEK